MSSTRVLIAEDEFLIAELIGALLGDLGLSTRVVYSGREAMDVIEAEAASFHVLVTDIRVGEPPDGWSVASAARKANPAIHVVYVTGDSMADWPTKGVADSKMLEKPFDPSQLASAVMTLLN